MQYAGCPGKAPDHLFIEAEISREMLRRDDLSRFNWHHGLPISSKNVGDAEACLFSSYMSTVNPAALRRMLRRLTGDAKVLTSFELSVFA
jgi:hypothetical protein